MTALDKQIGKRYTNGSVLIIANDHIDNRYKNLTSEEWEQKLKEIYIYLTIKNKRKSEEEAE